MKSIKSFFVFIVFLLVIASMPVNAATLPLMRAMSSGGNWGSGNTDGFQEGIPDAYIQYLLEDNVNWVGIKVSIFNKTISDPTVEVLYRSNNNDSINMYTYDDDGLINAITKFKENGINVYLSLVLTQHLTGDIESSTCNTAQYGVDMHVLGDTSMPTIENSNSWGYECIDPSLWWWDPSHPDHAANVAIFWETYTQVAVKYARIAEQYGVGMFALGEETDRLFRTRTTERFTNNFRNELTQMVSAVRAEYKGLLTYGQQSFVYLPHPEWWGLDTEASSSLFTDLGLDVVGISAAWQYEIAPNYSVADPRLYSVVEFEDGWTSVFNDYFVTLQANNPNIPIIVSA